MHSQPSPTEVAEVAGLPASPSEPALEAHPEAHPEAQFLQITLNGDLPLLLPGGNLVEIMKLAIGQVMPMFHMAPWVMGIYNWRGEMLWVADLGHFLGFAPWYNQAEAASRHSVVVIRPPYSAAPPADEQAPTLGLLVSAVEAMVTYPMDAIQPVPGTPLETMPDPTPAPTPEASFLSMPPIEPSLLPFLNGCCAADSGQPQLILDATAVLAAMAQLHP